MALHQLTRTAVDTILYKQTLTAVSASTKEEKAKAKKEKAKATKEKAEKEVCHSECLYIVCVTHRYYQKRSPEVIALLAQVDQAWDSWAALVPEEKRKNAFKLRHVKQNMRYVLAMIEPDAKPDGFQEVLLLAAFHEPYTNLISDRE